MESFRQLIEHWVLEYAEQYAAGIGIQCEPARLEPD